MQEIEHIAEAATDVQTSPHEKELLAALPQAFSALESLPAADRALVSSVVVTLTRGMEIDLKEFPSEESGLVAAVKDRAELDRYIYLVAGCVGEFWTSITMDHTPALREWSRQRMSDTGVRFGKALQLTNVLRDVPRDLRIGRCYLPEDELASAGLTPADLLDPGSGARARPVLLASIESAMEHYIAAEEYLYAIPRRCVRLRLAVLWPILIGLATLARLSCNVAWLNPARPSRVTRLWVYSMMAGSWPSIMSNTLLRNWIWRLRRQVNLGVEAGISHSQ